MADVRVQRVGDVDVVTIDRPEVRNALRFRSYDELERAVRDTTARCLVITGADPAFCSGDDVREVMGGGDGPKPTAVQPRLTPAADALLHTDVPIISRIRTSDNLSVRAQRPLVALFLVRTSFRTCS